MRKRRERVLSTSSVRMATSSVHVDSWTSSVHVGVDKFTSHRYCPLRRGAYSTLLRLQFRGVVFKCGGRVGAGVAGEPCTAPLFMIIVQYL
jgi:hypothetical protein